MNSYFVCLLILLCAKQLQGISEEYFECLDPEKTVNSHSDCTSIIIPDSDGYKCCSMKISYEKESSYNCFPIENKYMESQEIFKEYMSKSSMALLFRDTGGKMEIECPNEMKITENYEKFSDEYLSCYNSHINGVNNENDCTKIEIPTKEGNKCCFVESSQLNNQGNIIEDKRCYIIQDQYFTKEKNLGNYWLDDSNVTSFDQIVNSNITIKCKNYDTFYFEGKKKEIKSSDSSQTTPTDTSSNNNDNNDENSQYEELEKKITSKKGKSGLKAWAIVLIIIASLLVIGIITTFSVILYRKKKSASLKSNKNEVTEANSVIANKDQKTTSSGLKDN